MTTVSVFKRPSRAHLFRSFLEAKGVAADVFDESLATTSWAQTNPKEGIRVVVRDEDGEVATKLLAEFDGGTDGED